MLNPNIQRQKNHWFGSAFSHKIYLCRISALQYYKTHSFRCGNENIECVSNCKYLGIWLSLSGSYSYAQNKLYKKSLKAFFKNKLGLKFSPCLSPTFSGKKITDLVLNFHTRFTYVVYLFYDIIKQGTYSYVKQFNFDPSMFYRNYT
jgi:hypothetical protein